MQGSPSYPRGWARGAGLMRPAASMGMLKVTLRPAAKSRMLGLSPNLFTARFARDDGGRFSGAATRGHPPFRRPDCCFATPAKCPDATPRVAAPQFCHAPMQRARRRRKAKGLRQAGVAKRQSGPPDEARFRRRALKIAHHRRATRRSKKSVTLSRTHECRRTRINSAFAGPWNVL